MGWYTFLRVKDVESRVNELEEQINDLEYQIEELKKTIGIKIPRRSRKANIKKRDGEASFLRMG